MPRKTYNPYEIKVKKLNRFRGLVNPENELTIPDPYVGNSSNVESFRKGELTVRSGQRVESINYP